YVCAKLSDDCAGADWHLANGTASWVYPWTPPSDGSYHPRAYAVDAYGVGGPVADLVSVNVDQTPPAAASLGQSGTVFVTTEYLSETLATLHLTGRVTDTASAFTSGAGAAVLMIDDGAGVTTLPGRFVTHPVDEP